MLKNSKCQETKTLSTIKHKTLNSYFDIDTVKAGSANFEPSLSYAAISSGFRLPMVDTAPHIKNTTYIPYVLHQFRNSY